MLTLTARNVFGLVVVLGLFASVSAAGEQAKPAAHTPPAPPPGWNLLDTGVFVDGPAMIVRTAAHTLLVLIHAENMPDWPHQAFELRFRDGALPDRGFDYEGPAHIEFYPGARTFYIVAKPQGTPLLLFDLESVENESLRRHIADTPDVLFEHQAWIWYTPRVESLAAGLGETDWHDPYEWMGLLAQTRIDLHGGQAAAAAPPLATGNGDTCGEITLPCRVGGRGATAGAVGDSTPCLILCGSGYFVCIFHGPTGLEGPWCRCCPYDTPEQGKP